MEKEKKLLNAIGDIDEKYIEEAKPEKVVRITSKRSWKPLGVMAAAAVIILGLGIFMKMNVNDQSAAMMAPAKGPDAASPEKSEEPSADTDSQEIFVGMAEAAQEKSDGVPGDVKHQIDGDNAPALKSQANSQEPLEGPAVSEEDKAVPDDNGLQSRTMIANPWKDSDTLSEAEADAGFTMVIPEAVNEFAPAVYRSIKDDMLEVIYCDKDSLEAFRIRKAPQSEADISGDYSSYEFEKDITVSDITAHIKGNGTDVFTVTWSKDEFNYAVVIDENQHFAETDIEKLISEIN